MGDTDGANGARGVVAEAGGRLLPIGSVVRLAGAAHAVMVCGLAQGEVAGGEPGRAWDYSGVPWPEGSVSPRGSLLFDDAQVGEVLFLGLRGPAESAFAEAAASALRGARGGDAS